MDVKKYFFRQSDGSIVNNSQSAIEPSFLIICLAIVLNLTQHPEVLHNPLRLS